MEIAVELLNKAASILDPLLRDFTSTNETRLKKIANDVEDSDGWWNRHIYDRFGRWLDKKGYLPLLKKIIDYQKAVIDCYNYNFKVIEEIFKAARSHDGIFGARISEYDERAEIGVLLLQELAECLDPSIQKHELTVPDRLDRYSTYRIRKQNGEFVSVSELDSKLSKYYRQAQPHKFTDSEIEMFCNQMDAEDVFLDYSNFIYVNELNYGALEATGMVVFLGVKIAKDEVTSILTGEGYAEKAARENLSAIIDTVISSESNAQGFIKDHGTAKDLMLELIDAYEKHEKESFEKKFPNYKYTRYDKFVQLVGGIDVVKKLVDVYPEMLDYLFNDYSKGLEILDSLESLNGDNLSPEMKSAINQLRRDYDDKWKGTLNKLWNETVEFGFDQSASKVKKWIGEKFPTYKILKSLLEITGGQEKAEAYSKLLSLQNIANDTHQAFRKAVEKVQGGVYTDDLNNVQPGQYTSQDLREVENLFNLLKETNLTIYKTYRDMCIDDPIRQVYANEQIERLNRITMNNYSNYPRQSYYF